MTTTRDIGQRALARQVRGTSSLAKGEGRSPPTANRAPFVSRATDLLIVIGSDGCLKRLTPRFPRAFGYTRAELLDQPFISFLHPADRAATSAALDKLSRREPTRGFENRFRCKDDSYRRLAWTAMPTPEGLLCAVARDITERRRLNEEERARSLDAEQSAALARKERSLASVCHDLQQPLTVILAQTQLLQRQLARRETPQPEAGVGTRLAYILTAATRMRAMCQDLLDASVLQAGHALGAPLVATDLVALARLAVGEHELVSDLHQFVFDAEVPTLEAAVDGTRLHRVLANLLANAVKYSPNGGEVRVTVKPMDGPDGKSAQLVVRDKGVGIPPDDLPHIFDRFHRGANVVGRFDGHGLGLASARELVELQGGTISVESEDGQGSTFVVSLPLTSRPAVSAAGQSAAAMDGTP